MSRNIIRPTSLTDFDVITGPPAPPRARTRALEVASPATAEPDRSPPAETPQQTLTK